MKMQQFVSCIYCCEMWISFRFISCSNLHYLNSERWSCLRCNIELYNIGHYFHGLTILWTMMITFYNYCVWINYKIFLTLFRGNDPVFSYMQKKMKKLYYFKTDRRAILFAIKFIIIKFHFMWYYVTKGIFLLFIINKLKINYYISYIKKG